MREHYCTWKVVLAALTAVASYGQTQPFSTISVTNSPVLPAIQAGRPNGTYTLSGVESVNVYNGHVSIAIPILTVGGRGSSGYTMKALVSPAAWQADTGVDVDPNYNPSPVYFYNTTIGKESWNPYRAGYGPGSVVIKYSGAEYSEWNLPPGQGIFTHTLTHVVFSGPDGSDVQLYSTLNDAVVTYGGIGPPPSWNRGNTFRARDGSGMVFVEEGTAVVDRNNPADYVNGADVVPATGTLRFRDGTAYIVANGVVMKIRDRNGNETDLCYQDDQTFQTCGVTTGVSMQPKWIKDPLGRLIQIQYDLASGTPGVRYDQITYPGVGDGTGPGSRSVKVYRQDYQTRLRQDLAMPTRLFPEAWWESRTGDYAVSQVKLNNQQTYDIYYNPYGEVARVEAPTGGAYEYEYGAGVQGSLASGQMNDGYTPGDQQSSPNPARTIYVYRRVKQRRAYFSRQTAHGAACTIGQTGNTCESFSDYKLSESKTGAGSGIYEISFVDGYFEVETTGVNDARSRSRHYHLGWTSDGSEKLSPAQDLRQSSLQPNTLRGWVSEYTGKEWKTEDLNATGTALRTTTSTYAHNNYTKNANVTSSQTTLQDPGATVRVAKTDFEYDDQDNRSKVMEYSFANVKQRVIVTAYKKGEYVGSDYNLLSLPESETVYAGDEATKAAETQFTYDASTLAAVSACSGIVQHSGNFGAGSALKRGNATEVKRWISGSGGSVRHAASAFAYDEAGNIVQSRDPDQNLTSYEYASGYRCGLLTKITKAVNGVTHQSEAAYDLATGKPTEVKDAGGAVTKAGYESGLDRLAWMTRGEAGTAFPAVVQDAANKTKTSFIYDDVSQTLTTRGDIHSFDEWNSSPATAALSVAKFDGFGRQVGVQVYDGGANPVVTATRYDGLGRVWQQSNPCRSASFDCAGAVTEWSFDDLGRVTRVTAADGAETNTVHANEVVTVTDPASVTKTQKSDALGQLVEVAEPASEVTAYTYNPLGHLAQVTQQGVAGGAPNQTRTFLYDGLGRLTSATNPETSTISYTYSDGGNLLTRTDGRGTVTTIYDQAGRPSTRSYTTGLATGTVTYVWDTVKVGQLTSVGNPVSTTTYDYYPVGLVRQTTQATKALDSQQSEQTVTSVVGYEYNRAGGLGAVTYPSGRKVSYAADRAGRVSGVSGLMGTTTTTYGAGLEYSEHGALKAAQWGTGLAEAWSFNARLQPCQIQVTNRQSQAVLAGFELYYGNEAAACGASTVMTNNGNVLKQKILPLGVVQGFGYDSWNRLTHVDEKAGSVEQWRQDYVYDRWGNRAVNSTTSTAPVTNVTPQVADGSAAAMSGRYPGRNRAVMSGATVECGSANSQYDCAGNMILYGADTASAQKLVYDGENRLVEVKDSNNTTVARYFYDGDGRRVRRSSGGRETVYGYAADGQLLAEWEVAAQPTTNMTCTTCYFGVDHLGSTRIVAASDGTVEKRTDYVPFGEEAPAGWSGRTEAMKYELGVAARWNPQRVRFTGKERDGETGLDYFEARYMSSAQGRFTSTDPIISGPHKLSDPQNWNLYAYARNNPLKFTDPSGEIIVESVDPEYQKRYQSWKKDYLSTKAGQAQWDKYDNDTNFTLTITVDKAKKEGAEAGNYQWDSSGNLNAATIMLGPKIGSGYSSSVDYPVSSSLQGANVSGTILAVTKFAHEFGHVNRTSQVNAAQFQLQNQLIPQWTSLFMSNGRNANDPALKALEQRMGGNPNDIHTGREHWAESNTIPYLRDRFPAKSMPSQIRQAIQNYQKAYPGR